MAPQPTFTVHTFRRRSSRLQESHFLRRIFAELRSTKSDLEDLKIKHQQLIKKFKIKQPLETNSKSTNELNVDRCFVDQQETQCCCVRHPNSNWSHHSLRAVHEYGQQQPEQPLATAVHMIDEFIDWKTRYRQLELQLIDNLLLYDHLLTRQCYFSDVDKRGLRSALELMAKKCLNEGKKASELKKMYECQLYENACCKEYIKQLEEDREMKEQMEVQGGQRSRRKLWRCFGFFKK